MNKKFGYFGLFLVLSVLVVSLTLNLEILPSSSALTMRSDFNDNHYTARYSGGQKICGDHICNPGEYSQMQQALSQAQLKGKMESNTMPLPSSIGEQNMMSNNSTMQGQNNNMMNQEVMSSDSGSVLKL